MRTDHLQKVSTFALPFVFKNESLKNLYIKKFIDSGIEIRPMIAGNMQRQPFFKKYNPVNFNLPNTDFVHRNGFYCANYPELDDEDIQIIENCIL